MGLVIPSTGTNAKLLVGDSIETQNGFLIAPAINYIKNALFTSNTTTGWATYADAAGTTPVDGTGGSPNVTFTAQSGSLVRGTLSGRLTKDASNRQGQGASYNFTIDAADTGRPVSIAFDFLASSAYVANDVGVYIYDVTNATLITPAAINVAAGKGTFRAFFVATTSTSYRLILHVASTNASAWTLDTDNFQVGPQVQLSGAAVTDWQAYTPAITGFTTSALEGFWRRVGDVAQLRIQAVLNAAPSTTMQVGLPTGLSIDTTKAPGGSEFPTFGVIKVTDAGSGYYQGTVTQGNSNTALRFLDDDGGLVYNATVPISWVSGDTFSMTADVPIANWSSNVTSLAAADPEFAFNTGAVTAAGGSDTSSFGNGAAGTLINSFNSATYSGNSSTSLTCRFQSPIQSTDSIRLEFLPSGSTTWVPAVERIAHVDLSGATYGAFISPSSATDVIVQFGNGGATPGATYASTTGVTWAAINTWRWRVRKQSGLTQGILPVSARAVVGDTTGTAVPAGFIGEQVSASLSDVTLTTSTPANAGSISLGVGVWMVFYKGSVDYTSASTFTDARASISTTSAVQHAQSQVGDGATNTTAARLLGTSVRYLIVSSTQTIYAVIQASFTVGVNVRSSAASSQFYAVRIA